jgi:hypothetical protein
MKKNRLSYKTILCYLARFVPQAFRKFSLKRNAGGEGLKRKGVFNLFFNKQNEPQASSKMSFSEACRIIKNIQDEANVRIISVINNCEEHVLFGVTPPYVASYLNDLSKEPLSIKISKKSSHPVAFYSAASTYTTN